MSGTNKAAHNSSHIQEQSPFAAVGDFVYISHAAKKRKVDREFSSASVAAFGSGVQLKHKSRKFQNGTNLPPEIWAKILGYVVDAEESAVPCLPNASKVCSAWRMASHAPFLWTALRFSAKVIKNERSFKKKTESFEILASRCFQRVRDLQCIGLPKATQKIVSTVASNAEALTSVSLQQGGTVTYKSCLKDLVTNHGSTLEEFSLLNTDVGSSDLGKTLLGLGCALKSLQIVHQNPRPLNFLFSHLKNLTELKIDCGAWFELGRLKELHGLRVVHLINMAMGTSGVFEIEWPDLEDIDLRYHSVSGVVANQTENRIVSHVLSTTTKLRKVCFRYRKMCLCDFFNIIMDNTSIEHLDLSGFYGEHFNTTLFVLGDSVKTLYLDNFLGLNSALAISLDPNIWGSLQFLSIQNTDIEFAVLKLLMGCLGNIEKLDLSSCRGLPRGMKKMWRDITALKRLLE